MAGYKYQPVKNPNSMPVIVLINGVLSCEEIFKIAMFDDEINCQAPSIPIGIIANINQIQNGSFFISCVKIEILKQ